jgi:hypothetical protein
VAASSGESPVEGTALLVRMDSLPGRIHTGVWQGSRRKVGDAWYTTSGQISVSAAHRPLPWILRTDTDQLNPVGIATPAPTLMQVLAAKSNPAGVHVAPQIAVNCSWELTATEDLRSNARSNGHQQEGQGESSLLVA